MFVRIRRVGGAEVVAGAEQRVVRGRVLEQLLRRVDVAVGAAERRGHREPAARVHVRAGGRARGRRPRCARRRRRTGRSCAVGGDGAVDRVLEREVLGGLRLRALRADRVVVERDAVGLVGAVVELAEDPRVGVAAEARPAARRGATPGGEDARAGRDRASGTAAADRRRGRRDAAPARRARRWRARPRAPPGRRARSRTAVSDLRSAPGASRGTRPCPRRGRPTRWRATGTRPRARARWSRSVSKLALRSFFDSPSARVGPAARRAASSSAVVATPSVSSAQRYASPRSTASAPVQPSPSITIALARGRPTRRGSRYAPPASATRPHLWNDQRNLVAGPVTTKSQASARCAPGPTAAPCTAATVGLSISHSSRMNVCTPTRSASAVVRGSKPGLPACATVDAPRSMPAQNASPVARSRNARTAGIGATGAQRVDDAVAHRDGRARASRRVGRA